MPRGSTLYSDNIPRFQRSSLQATTRKCSRWSTINTPICHFSDLVCDVNVKRYMRIHPYDLRYHTFHHDRLIQVESRHKRVVCQNWRRYQE